MTSPGLYSLIELITSMPGAPDRSTRFSSLRCGASCEKPEPGRASASARTAASDVHFMSLPPVEFASEVLPIGLRNRLIGFVERIDLVFRTGLLFEWTALNLAI